MCLSGFGQILLSIQRAKEGMMPAAACNLLQWDGSRGRSVRYSSKGVIASHPATSTSR